MNSKSRSLSLLCLLAVVLFAWVAWSATGILESGAEPHAVVARFDQRIDWLTRGVPLVFLALLVLQSRAYRRQAVSGWSYVFGWLFLACFTALDYIWLTHLVFRYTKDHDIWEGGFNVMALMGIGVAILGGFVSVFAYLFERSRRQRG